MVSTWYKLKMTKEQIFAVLENVRSWPPEDQEELAEVAREIEARRKGVYVMDDDERAAVREGQEQARRGEFVPDDEMDAFWRKIGVV
jgi:predicted transcriptional regulator